MRKFILSGLIFPIILSACTKASATIPSTALASTPTLSPLQQYMPPTRNPGDPIVSPTPDIQNFFFPTYTPIPDSAVMPLVQSVDSTPLPSPTAPMLSHTVESGEFPASIAQKYGISVEDLLTANNITENDIIYPGDVLNIPKRQPSSGGPGASASALEPVGDPNVDYFKILPDSELVYGPMTALFDLKSFVYDQGGYLSTYMQDVNGDYASGTEVVLKVAQNYSVNPRVLLALLEYRSGWVTNPQPLDSTTYTPIAYVDDFHTGLYRQLVWAANILNEGYYGWKDKRIQSFTLLDGSVVIPDPGINAGTAAVQYMLSKINNLESWKMDVGPDGFYATYNALFGYPFDYAVEPLLPTDLVQPVLSLPIPEKETWHFTGGPHAGWDSGSAWAALDFAPPGDPIGCADTDAWEVAVAPGIIARSGGGVVVLDLDGDGYEQTGWSILYLHVATRGRVEEGAHVSIGDRIGHPSCEGGMANANHLHIARRYNGVWIPAADPKVPFTMDGLVAYGSEVEYDGHLTGNGQDVEAWDGTSPINQVTKK